MPEGRPADLVRIGGVYADLHSSLSKRAEDSNALAMQGVEEHDSPGKGGKPKL